MAMFERDGIRFNYVDDGSGVPFVFQHGLGGELGQPLGVFQPVDGIRFLSFDCRGHGATEPLGDAAKFGIESFADDLAGFLDHVGVDRAVVGGISMGAAVAVKFARRYPERLLGLVLSRPAWLTGPTWKNIEIYGQIAQWLRDYGASKGLDWLVDSELYAEILKESPDNAASLIKQFQAPDSVARAVRLERIPLDAATGAEAELRAIGVPTLIIASQQDVVHPFEFGVELERLIPDSILVEVTPKSLDAEAHVSDCGDAISQFLRERVLGGG